MINSINAGLGLADLIAHDQSKFLDYKHLVRPVSDKADEKYLGDVLGINNKFSDQDVGVPLKV